MKIYVMDAFAAKLFGGNQAGVALPEGDVSDETMRLIAAELKHSETAFVRPRADGSVDLRYFTPAGEVELCGHATIASFALLRRLGLLADGRHVAHTKAGDLQISVDGEVVWMDMAPPRWLGELTRVEWEPLYRAFGLTGADRPRDLTPQIVSTGLADIMMPVRDRETLLRARQNETLVAELSRRQKVTGVHMFCLGDKTCTAWCRNFAPLYDIPAAGPGKRVHPGRAYAPSLGNTQPSDGGKGRRPDPGRRPGRTEPVRRDLRRLIQQAPGYRAVEAVRYPGAFCVYNPASGLGVLDEDEILHQVHAVQHRLHPGLNAHDVREHQGALLLPDGGHIFAHQLFFAVMHTINRGKTHGSFPLQHHQRLRQLLVAHLKVHHGVVDQLGRLAVAQVVGQLVQLLGVVLVVAQHIGQHSHPLLQAGVAVVMGVIVVMVVMMLAHSDAPPCFFAHFSTARG